MTVSDIETDDGPWTREELLSRLQLARRMLNTAYDANAALEQAILEKNARIRQLDAELAEYRELVGYKPEDVR